MSDCIATFFGPLDKQSCVYYLFLTMLFFGLLVFAIIAEIIFVFKNFCDNLITNYIIKIIFNLKR